MFSAFDEYYIPHCPTSKYTKIVDQHITIPFLKSRLSEAIDSSEYDRETEEIIHQQIFVPDPENDDIDAYNSDWLAAIRFETNQYGQIMDIEIDDPNHIFDSELANIVKYWSFMTFDMLYSE